MIEIREADIRDAEILAQLGRITFIESHSQFINNDKEVNDFCNSSFKIVKIREEIQNQNIRFWLLFYDKIPVGFAKVILNSPNDYIKNENTCKLDKIYILNDFLGKGLGKKLHTSIIEKVRKLNMDSIWLVTYILNYKAIRFYESNQYEKLGFIDFIVAEKGYKNHILVKKINK